MSDIEEEQDLVSVEQLTNYEAPLSGEEVSPEIEDPSTIVVETNGDQPIVEYATIAADGTAIAVEGIPQMVVVQQPDLEPTTYNGIDVGFLTSVVQFCRNAGLKETENVLAKEVGFTIAGEEPDDQTSLDYDEICQEFQKMINLLDSMFENIRAEFSTLFFPIFAHLYIKIVHAGDFEFAKQFMTKFSPHIPSTHFAQVDLLRFIISPIQLQTCELVENLSEHQYGVRLSKSCQKQLDTFLSKNPVIAEIVRKHVQIEIIEIQSKAIPYLDFFNGGLLGHSPIDKKQKVYYGVVRDDVVVVGDKKKRKDLKDAKKKDSNAPPPDRIPLPFVPEFVLEERKQAYREATKKGRISAENPPSVCIFNACNTNGGLSSAEISENCSLFALGLNDGSVHLRSLADDHIKQIKHSSKLEAIQNDDDMDFDIYEEFSPDKKPKKAVFSGHSAAVTSTCFAPDRRVLFTSSLDATTRLWGVEMRRELVVYRHPSAVYHTKLCNRGLYFVSSCSDQSVHLWSSERIHPIRLFTDPFGATHALDFHPNCNYIIGGSNDRVVRMWDVLTSSCVRTFSGHRGGIRGIKTSPDGRYIVSYSEDGALCVWDIGQQKLAAVQQCEPCPTKVPIQFTRDGSVFAVGTPHWGLSFFSLESVISGDTTEPKVDPPNFLIHQYLTKKTPILDFAFNRKNLVICIGALEQ